MVSDLNSVYKIKSLNFIIIDVWKKLTQLNNCVKNSYINNT